MGGSRLPGFVGVEGEAMKRFTLTEDHITLLRAAWVSWGATEEARLANTLPCPPVARFGAPAIDCKRPYGNSCVRQDIASLLLIEPVMDCGDHGDGNFTNAQISRIDTVHRETETALQIVLRVGEFRPGVYEKKDWGGGWLLVSARGPHSTQEEP